VRTDYIISAFHINPRAIFSSEFSGIALILYSHLRVYYEGFQGIQTMGAVLLTLTGLVMGCWAAACWACCLLASYWRRSALVASKLNVLDCIQGWALI